MDLAAILIAALVQLSLEYAAIQPLSDTARSIIGDRRRKDAFIGAVSAAYADLQGSQYGELSKLFLDEYYLRKPEVTQELLKVILVATRPDFDHLQALYASSGLGMRSPNIRPALNFLVERILEHGADNNEWFRDRYRLILEKRQTESTEKIKEILGGSGPNDSSLRLVDISFAETEEFPKLDVKVRNVGNRVAFMKEAIFVVKKIWRIESFIPPASMPVSWNYDVLFPIKEVPYSVSHKVSQAIAPNEVDRFTFTLGHDNERGGWKHSWVFLISLELVYDENDKSLRSQDILFLADSAVVIMSTIDGPFMYEFRRTITLRNIRTVDEVAQIQALRSEELENTIAEFKKIPYDAFLEEEKADLYWKQGDYATALESYERSFELHSSNELKARKYDGLGGQCKETNLYDEAEKYYQRAIRLDPTWSTAYNDLAELYWERRDYARAVERFEVAARLGNDSSEMARAYVDLGDHFKGIGEYQDAMRYYQKAIESGPDLYTPYASLGDLLLERGEYFEAAELFEESAKRAKYNQSKALQYRNAGLAYQNLKAFEQAITSWHKAIELDPKLIEPYSDLAMAHLRNGDETKAQEYNEKALQAIEYPYEKARVNYVFGNGFLKLERFEEAVSRFEAATSLAPGEALYHLVLGRAYQELKRDEEAVTCWQKASEIEPESGLPYSYWGGLAYDRGRYEEAIKHYEQSAKLNAAHVNWNNWGRVFYALGRYEEASAAYKRAIEMTPNDAIPQRNLGLVWEQIGNVKSAIASWLKAIELNPQWQTPYEDLRRVHLGKQDYSGALEYYEKVAELQESDEEKARSYSTIGDKCLGVKRYEDAIRYYEKAGEFDVTIANWNNLGTAYLTLKRIEEAIAAYRKAIEVRPKNAVPHRNLGLVQERIGQPDEAIASWQRAIELEPGWATPYQDLARLYQNLRQDGKAKICLEKAAELEHKSKMILTGQS